MRQYSPAQRRRSRRCGFLFLRARSEIAAVRCSFLETSQLFLPSAFPDTRVRLERVLPPSRDCCVQSKSGSNPEIFSCAKSGGLAQKDCVFGQFFYEWLRRLFWTQRGPRRHCIL